MKSPKDKKAAEPEPTEQQKLWLEPAVRALLKEQAHRRHLTISEHVADLITKHEGA